MASDDRHQVTVAEEFIKNPDLKEEDLQELRGWITTQKHLPEVSDMMLIIFHHSCYYDLEATKNCIEKYYTMRTNTPEIFSNRDINSSDLARSAQVLGFAALPVPDPDGNQIYYQRLRNCDSSQYVYVDHVKLLNMILDALLLQRGTIPGFVIVCDLMGYSMSHIPKHPFSIVKSSTQYMQEASPIRLKGIHMTNVYWWVPQAFNMVKPFINKDVAEKMHFHKTNSTLYDYIPRECLPEESGGYLESIEKYHAVSLMTLESESLRDFFVEDETARVDETKRETRSKE